MKTTLRDELLRIQDLEANIQASKEILEREQTRLEALQKKCNHDIVIVADVPSPGYAVRAKCLLCGRHFDSPHALREIPDSNTLIEACYCKKFHNYCESKIYEFMATEARIATITNPNFTKKELGEYLEQRLKED